MRLIMKCKDTIEMALTKKARRRRIIVAAISYAFLYLGGTALLLAALLAFCGFASLILIVCGVG